nr:TMV resistance protein N-like [Quercus suber]
MDHPTEDYGKLSQAFVDYSKGLPLALEILGSFLFKKSIGEWKSELGRLTKFCDRGILNVLQISFDGLQPTEKDIFLNIACFFNHKNGDDVIKILDYLELHAEIGLRVLIDKSLIKFHENQLWMHDLLQEMGRDIVCQECKDLEERSRLWSFENINNGTKQIQGIVLEMHEPKNVDWNPEAFSKMRNLKLLKICGVQLMRDLKHLPTSLRILDWRGYPSKSLTSSSQSKSFENLKFIELSKSLKLIEAPDTIKVPNLESLVLEGCINLLKIHPSIGIHKKLTILNLQGCKNLTSLPSKFEMECLTDLDLHDHLWLVYVTPQFLDENFKKLLLGGDANGFCEIGIEFETKDSIWEVKKCGLHVIYKKDIEDLDRTMIQYSNSSITPYGDLDVFHHNFNNSAVVVECHKVKHSYDDCDGLDPVEKEALMTYQTQKGLKGRQKPKVTLIVRSQVSTRTVMKS